MTEIEKMQNALQFLQEGLSELQQKDKRKVWFCNQCSEGPCEIRTRSSEIPDCPFDLLHKTRFVKLQEGEMTTPEVNALVDENQKLVNSDEEPKKKSSAKKPAKKKSTKKNKPQESDTNDKKNWSMSKKSQFIVDEKAKGRNITEIAHELGLRKSTALQYFYERSRELRGI